MYLVGLCSPRSARAQSASLEAPEAVVAGAPVVVKCTGPNTEYDLLAMVKAGTPEKTDPGSRLQSGYVDKSPQQLVAPEEAGEYEIRYVARGSMLTLARRKLMITPASATVEAPSSAAAGATIKVKWTGPNNEYDKVVVVPAGSSDKVPQNGLGVAWTRHGNPASVRVPEKAGEYEVRYVTGINHTILATAKLTVGAVTASIEPAKAVAGTKLEPRWTGPANESDRIAVVPVGAPEEESGVTWAFIVPNTPTVLRVPLKAGVYEMRCAPCRTT